MMTNEDKYKLINELADKYELINELADEYQRTATERDVALDELNQAKNRYLALRVRATNLYNEWLKIVTGNYLEI